MLQSVQNLQGFKVHASNGDMGHIKDFYFDDQEWAIRYMVVDYGNIVDGHHKVLLTPKAYDHTEWTEGKVFVNLTREQIADSPDPSTHIPVSHLPRRIEHFSFEDEHLYSFKDIKGFHIVAVDGEIGHVLDLMVNEETWEITSTVLSTHNWWPGKQVLITPDHIKRIGWTEKKVYVDMSREQIKHSPS